jgi:hypothetical protein
LLLVTGQDSVITDSHYLRGKRFQKLHRIMSSPAVRAAQLRLHHLAAANSAIRLRVAVLMAVATPPPGRAIMTWQPCLQVQVHTLRFFRFTLGITLAILAIHTGGQACPAVPCSAAIGPTAGGGQMACNLCCPVLCAAGLFAYMCGGPARIEN